MRAADAGGSEYRLGVDWMWAAFAVVVLLPLAWLAWIVVTHRRGMASACRRAAEQHAILAIQLEEAGRIDEAKAQRAMAARLLDDERYFLDS